MAITRLCAVILRYLSKVAAASTTTCGTSNWLVQAASKNDFIDDEMGYFELKGEWGQKIVRREFSKLLCSGASRAGLCVCVR